MYYIQKNIEIAGSHRLTLDYESPCSRLHGHNWKIKVCCKSETLDNNGMIVDFMKIKNVVNQLDHQNLNDVLHFNPTAENIAHWITEQIPSCYRCEVEETDGNLAIYEKDED